MRSLLVFLFVSFALVLAGRSQAAATASPVVSGYSGGNFSSPAGSYTPAAANDGYMKPAVAQVAGKPVTVPASMKMAANAGQYAKNAMKLNPWAIAGTLAAGWLAAQGLEWMDGWKKSFEPSADDYPGGTTWYHLFGTGACTVSVPNFQGCSATAAADAYFSAAHPGITYNSRTFLDWASTPTDRVYRFNYVSGPPPNNTYNHDLHIKPYTVPAAPTTQPATDDDWDNAGDPLPVVGPELPSAPYMQSGSTGAPGVPVQPPKYNFPPFSVPIGSPYQKPDGTTVQPMAKVSPAGDSIVYDTYDLPILSPQSVPIPLTDGAGNPLNISDINGNPVPLQDVYGNPVTPPAPALDANGNPLPFLDANGNPLTSGSPQPTPEPEKTDCDKFPNSVGCADLGTPPDGEILPKEEVAITFSAPGSASASCPAPMAFSVFGQSISVDYDAICTYANGLRPVVIAIAYLTALFIIFGAPRSAQS